MLCTQMWVAQRSFRGTAVLRFWLVSFQGGVRCFLVFSTFTGTLFHLGKETPLMRANIVGTKFLLQIRIGDD